MFRCLCCSKTIIYRCSKTVRTRLVVGLTPSRRCFYRKPPYNQSGSNYYIEPLSETRHIKVSLMKRYLRFTKMLSESRKNGMRNLYNAIRNDCQSITVYNLRNIFLQNGDLKLDFLKTPFYNLPTNESWRVPLMREILNIKNGKSVVLNFTNEELETIERFTCCNQKISHTCEPL